MNIRDSVDRAMEIKDRVVRKMEMRVRREKVMEIQESVDKEDRAMGIQNELYRMNCTDWTENWKACYDLKYIQNRQMSYLHMKQTHIFAKHHHREPKLMCQHSGHFLQLKIFCAHFFNIFLA